MARCSTISLFISGIHSPLDPVNRIGQVLFRRVTLAALKVKWDLFHKWYLDHDCISSVMTLDPFGTSNTFLVSVRSTLPDYVYCHATGYFTHSNLWTTFFNDGIIWWYRLVCLWPCIQNIEALLYQHWLLRYSPKCTLWWLSQHNIKQHLHTLFPHKYHMPSPCPACFNSSYVAKYPYTSLLWALSFVPLYILVV